MNLSDTPQQYRGYQEDPKRIWYSDPNIALTREVTIPAGYGFLPGGTILGEISESTNRAGQYVPYAQEDPSADTDNFFGAYLLADGLASGVCEVTLGESYKFAVGDHLVAMDGNTKGGSAIDLGAVVSIDRTTYPNKAIVTVTNNVTTAITVDQSGAIAIQTTTSAPFTKALGMLLGGVDTGIGEHAKGAQGVIVLSNAMAYKGVIKNYDAEAKTDLGNIETGQFIVLK